MHVWSSSPFRWLRAGIAAVTFAATAASCAELGVVGDGGSVSWGRVNDGMLLDGAVVPSAGPGFWRPPTWRARGITYGTDEMVALLVGVAGRMNDSESAPRLGIADVAYAGGGETARHASHRSGRDADVLFFVTDVSGKPVDNVAMRRFDGSGRTEDDVFFAGVGLRFDTPRNWRLIKTLLAAPEADVQRIFCFEPLIQHSLDYARSIGEPEWMLDYARRVLMQPSDSAPHYDHFHVRIRCSAMDVREGCVDTGEELVKKPRAHPATT